MKYEHLDWKYRLTEDVCYKIKFKGCAKIVKNGTELNHIGLLFIGGMLGTALPVLRLIQKTLCEPVWFMMHSIKLSGRVKSRINTAVKLIKYSNRFLKKIT